MHRIFFIKPSSGRRACTGGHLTAKKIERNARDETMKPSSGRRAHTGGHLTFLGYDSAYRNKISKIDKTKATLHVRIEQFECLYNFLL
jgi:hypothetical protein